MAKVLVKTSVTPYMRAFQRCFPRIPHHFPLAAHHAHTSTLRNRRRRRRAMCICRPHRQGVNFHTRSEVYHDLIAAQHERRSLACVAARCATWPWTSFLFDYGESVPRRRRLLVCTVGLPAENIIRPLEPAFASATRIQTERQRRVPWQRSSADRLHARAEEPSWSRRVNASARCWTVQRSNDSPNTRRFEGLSPTGLRGTDSLSLKARAQHPPQQTTPTPRQPCTCKGFGIP
jgi:hypothetical protein